MPLHIAHIPAVDTNGQYPTVVAVAHSAGATLIRTAWFVPDAVVRLWVGVESLDSAQIA